MSSRLAAALALALATTAGCGLTLDYDPPTDGGGAFDAPGGCGVCAPGTTCIAGSCRHPCTVPSDCHSDDAACETCDTALGACVVAEVTCGDECGAICDPSTDRCAPNCPTGQSCVGGVCTSPRTCTGAGDCADLTGGPCGRAECVAGLCQDVLPGACVEIVYDCAEIDRCEGCAVVPRPERCGGGSVCTGAPDHRCVECTNADLTRCDPGQLCDPSGTCRDCAGDTDCTAAGQPPWCVGGRCVGCRDGGDCVRTGDGAACVDGVCIGCLSDADCTADGRPVCDPSGTCVACRRSGECPVGERCFDGTCRGCLGDTECPPFLFCDGATGRCSARMCRFDSDCPSTPCAGASRCLAGRCIHPGAITSDFCDDGIACTRDSCAPDAPDADANGCRFVPEHLSCLDDLVGCTVQSCAGDVPGADGDGCVTRHLDRLCAILDSACAVGVCVGRAGGVTGDVSGCRTRLDPSLCGPGVCALDGECDPPPGCAGCADDGWDCNGNETCVGGECRQIFDGTGGCFGRCGEFCRDDGSCGFRPTFGGALCATP